MLFERLRARGFNVSLPADRTFCISTLAHACFTTGVLSEDKASFIQSSKRKVFSKRGAAWKFANLVLSMPSSMVR
jgi:hypothetical protein